MSPSANIQAMAGPSQRQPEPTQGEFGAETVRSMVASVPMWWHSIDLGHEIVTPGVNSLDFLTSEWELLDLPDLAGLSVLDVGAWDGFFSFEAERSGAARVVALDHYVWSLDLAGQQAYWKRCRDEGVTPLPYHLTEYWRPSELPGKRGFDVAHRVLGSRVETVVDDVMTGDPKRWGTFDIVLYLGVLYHMEDPLGAMRRIAGLTDKMAVISTQAIEIRGSGDRALFEFYPGAELNHDVSNWWAPNLAAIRGLCMDSGFTDVEVLLGPPDDLLADDAFGMYRAIVRASK